MKQDIITPLPPKGDPWRDNELVRRMRIRDDAKRSMSVNLTETIALSHELMKLAAGMKRD
jgi:hypothetical protein